MVPGVLHQGTSFFRRVGRTVCWCCAIHSFRWPPYAAEVRAFFRPLGLTVHPSHVQPCQPTAPGKAGSASCGPILRLVSDPSQRPVMERDVVQPWTIAWATRCRFWDCRSDEIDLELRQRDGSCSNVHLKPVLLVGQDRLFLRAARPAFLSPQNTVSFGYAAGWEPRAA